jgi:pimeloyl-ACP methyl ester carboxylesterase
MYGIISAVSHLASLQQNMLSLQMQQVTLSQSPVYYQQAGEGPPLLLVHGWGGSSRNWQPTFQSLADIRTMYAPDLPGYGESPPLNDAPDAVRMATLLIEFADALGLERFDIVGHAFGAGLGAYIAAHWPARVRRLVLTCFSTFRNELERRMVEQAHRQVNMWMALWQPWMVLWEPWMALWQPWMVRLNSPSSRPVYRAMTSRFFYQVPADETLLREGFADFLRMDRRTALESAISSGSPVITAALERVQAPTLLIGARQDTVMPPSGVEIVAHLVPDCRQVWIDQCGHLPMIEKAEEYHQVVRTFLTSDLTGADA